ncbi:MAG: hypothetical protein CO137_03835 [Candidatus Magasanikbacteria bacterium CG_4_9_14_3_um_filter_32_9]|uniref:Uncharacterized protein n=1 Tax=Candidatus Magasanikbacteria bacterium CG_4_9_14_3_um_filter_32_9 TaxID=1974644 RepID=A0A2M7Z5Y9_9BACT|nr:MAG: hypothetical protein CO137_03835 [Candidatus Magasanikbacteria bacterium CG_4_9_14_3_um_filter_32_9]
MKILRTRTFQWWEIGIIKLCLISFGIILGLYFFNFLISLLWFWWLLFIMSTIFFIVNFFREIE